MREVQSWNDASVVDDGGNFNPSDWMRKPVHELICQQPGHGAFRALDGGRVDANLPRPGAVVDGQRAGEDGQKRRSGVAVDIVASKKVALSPLGRKLYEKRR